MWQPLNDRLLVKRMADPETKKLIVPPEAYAGKWHVGEVLATGPGKWIEGINGGRVRRRMDVKPGDIVAFGRFTDWEEKNCVIVQEDDIIFKSKKTLIVKMDEFTHNELGVDRFSESLEARYERTAHG
jgi:co-chaperonin GroES (HSP10)